ncbi:protein of unassigned function [Methylobacterium oryzae CBMB20]|uniref:Protein of unassigned function n=1 Tax=Methylobacterium oryzae CBMB20 TaxID=693986 RepID=A0A089Q1A9_9HYPH|nr:protein of unassigned function [Methylobacterium oryzae CBMB20]
MSLSRPDRARYVARQGKPPLNGPPPPRGTSHGHAGRTRGGRAGDGLMPQMFDWIFFAIMLPFPAYLVWDFMRHR